MSLLSNLKNNKVGEMMAARKRISKPQFEFLSNQLEYHRSNNLIDRSQKDAILSSYDINGGLNFIKVMVIIGSVLIGLGILSFIASNWAMLVKPVKFFIILVGYIAAGWTGYGLENRYPKTARSLIYLSLIIFGAGIFLIGQMFNYGGHFTQAYLLWALGVIPMGVILRDKALFVAVQVLTLIYLNGYFDLRSVPYLVTGLIGLYYYFNRFFDDSYLNTFLTNAIVINFVVFLCIHYEVESIYILFLTFSLGLLMYFWPSDYQAKLFRFQGSIVIGVTGLLLTIAEVWEDLSYISLPESISVLFAIAFILFLLWLTRKGNLISLMFICMTILRYYFDTAYDFMPKAVFFITGGLILLGFGYYFERLRNRRGGIGL